MRFFAITLRAPRSATTDMMPKAFQSGNRTMRLGIFGITSFLLWSAVGLCQEKEDKPWRGHAIAKSGNPIQGLNLADVNGDDRVDLLVTRKDEPLMILLQPENVREKGKAWRGISLGKANKGAGQPHLIPAAGGSAQLLVVPSGSRLDVYQVPAGGGAEIYDSKAWKNFEIPMPNGLGNLKEGRVHDLDGNGQVDVILGGDEEGDHLVALSPGSHFWLPSYWDIRVLVEDARMTSIDVRDLDGDGDADVAWAHRMHDNFAQWAVNPGKALAETEEPWERHRTSESGKFITDLEAAEFVQPQLPDHPLFLTTGINGRVRYYYRMGEGIQARVGYNFSDTQSGSTIDTLAVADVDQDELLDLVMNLRTRDDERMALLWMSSATPLDAVPLDEYYTVITPVAHGDRFKHLMARDVDGDGDVDVIANQAADNAGSDLWWYENPLKE